MDITLKSKLNLNRHKRAIVKKILRSIIEKVEDMENDNKNYINANEIIKELLVDIPTTEKIGSRIRSLRIKKGITQLQLCEKSGLTQPQLSSIENNKHIPSMETLKKISNALKIRIDSLLL